MKENIIRDKSFSFAIRIVNLYKYLSTEKREYILSKQVLRSGTSIGSNIEEAIGGHTSKDFLAKLSISYKEARETIYWIRILASTNYITRTQSDSLLSDCEELCKIIAKIQITTKTKIDNS